MTSDKNQTCQISLALPAYNEEKNITTVLDRSVGSLEKLGRSWEILVIDNFSTDSTAEKVEQYRQKEPRVRLIRHEENRLYSGSCATAIREAQSMYLCIMDADEQFVAADIPSFLEKLEQGYNFVIGWRKKRNDPLMRRIASAIFNRMGKFYLGYPMHDLNCGIRMFDRKFMQVAEIKHQINMTNPEFFVRAKLAGMKMAEVPVSHFERTKGVTSHDFLKSWRIFARVRAYMHALRKELKQV